MSETHRYANISTITRETLLDTRLVAPGIYAFKHSVKTRVVAQEGVMRGSRPAADPTVQQGFIDEDNLKKLVGGRSWSKLDGVFAVTAEGREILRRRGQVMDDKDADRKRLRDATTLPVFDAFADGRLTPADLYRADKATGEAFSVLDGKVLPKAVHFDYIEARMSNAAYDLDRAAAHLLGREDIWMFPAKNTWWREPVFSRRAAPGDDVVLDVDGINSEPGRDKYLRFTWAPSQEAYEIIAGAERQNGMRANRFKTIFDRDLLGLRACGAALCEDFYASVPAPDDEDRPDLT